jgi:hypothetical protein
MFFKRNLINFQNLIIDLDFTRKNRKFQNNDHSNWSSNNQDIAIKKYVIFSAIIPIISRLIFISLVDCNRTTAITIKMWMQF